MPHVVTISTMISESVTTSFETRAEALDHVFTALPVMGWAVIDWTGGDDPNRLVFLAQRRNAAAISFVTTQASNALKKQHWDEKAARSRAAKISTIDGGKRVRIYRRPRGDHFIGMDEGSDPMFIGHDGEPIVNVALYYNGKEIEEDS